MQPDLDLLPDTAEFQSHVLFVGGCSLSDLAARYGTPLYIYDECTLRQGARDAMGAFADRGARVSFACKACSLGAVLRILCTEGLDLDVVSLGEMEAGLAAGFRPDQIHLHGNCLTDRELERAVTLKLHAVVVDSLDMLHALAAVCTRLDATSRVMLRLSLPLEAETHPHLVTSGRGSKFGMYVESPDLGQALDHISSSHQLELVGLHVHLGSQIHDVEIFARAAAELDRLTPRLNSPMELSVGGGWAVAYAPGDPSLTASRVATTLSAVPLAGHRLAVEPGRALVARAGVALYTVGSVKASGKRRIVAVDGGMGDNLRPALYGARYTALPVRWTEDEWGPCQVVGRYCESSDVIARDVLLPPLARGDVLCVPVSGAYHLAMASAYNLVPPPAAVMVSGGHARPILRRASTRELLARDIP